jgi:hypothetical protein
MTEAQNPIADLRNQLAELENKRVILEARRDEISFAALVERDPKAIKQAADIGAELAQLGHNEAMLNAALKTAIKREADAAAAESADRQRADLEKAHAMLPEVEAAAAQIDEAMKVLRETTVAFEQKWAVIKELSGAGPLPGATKIHVGRAFRTGLRGLPGFQIDLVSPTQRTTTSALSAGWSEQVRRAVSEINTSAAKDAA